MFGEDCMAKKNVLVIGSGGREDAFAWKLGQSSHVANVFVAPGNGGTLSRGFHQVLIQPTNIGDLIGFAKANGIGLTIVGPEEPLAMGIVDAFEDAHLHIVGPSRVAAELEASKAFAKNLMMRADVPTAEFNICHDFTHALNYVTAQNRPLVIKASGLALGKGVLVCHTFDEARNALKAIMLDRIFGDAGREVVIEEFLEGREISLHALCANRDYVLFRAAQDHKRAYDGDEGPNTGGMGAIAPVPWVSRETEERIAGRVIEPILDALVRSGRSFRGCLYPGLMIQRGDPYVLEYNVRFGDPETQVLMRLLKSDLFKLFAACAEGNLSQCRMEWHPGFAVCVVLASGGYPGKYEKGHLITGIEAAEKVPGVVVFHAGTVLSGTELRTAGGRVLGVTATGPTLLDARGRAYEAVRHIKFEGMQYRTDIGEKALAGFDR